MLGFERKARLFCDDVFHNVIFSFLLKSWDLSVRLGYFVTKVSLEKNPPSQLLGFERKARLFCDLLKFCLLRKAPKSWDLSVRLGYFVTFVPIIGHKKNKEITSWDLSVRLGYFVTVLLFFDTSYLII